MKTVTEFPRKVVEFPDMGIIMPDGCRLSARVWMPADAADDPVPAILEHLPYRKRDGTIYRDQLTHPYFAGHGYASIRVDMRGNGDSEGLMDDEYSEQELQDACDVIAWAADQPWCNGNVGMMGISWGGFNCLQVASKRPPALKAVISLCSTVDRYADDIHYKGGCLLIENFGWASTMLSYSSRPPDPLLAGDNRWRDLWLTRLENQPFLASLWLKHQHRDAYWKRGSICEDYSAIHAAVLSIGGWHDGYRNTISHLAANIEAPVKGIVGPWIHKYPHYAAPEPRIGFLQEALRWWDRWLKDIDTGVEADPAYRAYVMDSVRPARWHPERPGRWVAESEWPSPNIKTQEVELIAEGKHAIVASPQNCGLAGGEYFPFTFGPELPGDQRPDDALSVCFDQPVLTEAIDIVGAPEVLVRVSADRRQANIAVRLCDVHPDGASELISYGVLNLTHRNSHEFPEAVVPGETVSARVVLDQCAYRAPAGHRLRVAISNSYWPMIWPSPEPVRLELSAAALMLPLRPPATGDEVTFPAPEGATPWARETLRPANSERHVDRDEKTGMTTLSIVDDFGEVRDLEHGLAHGSIARETWAIHPDNPLSASGKTHWTQTLSRNEWSVRTETFAEMRSDAQSFVVSARIEAYEGEKLVFERNFKEKIPRVLL
ncbi:CocE/NonD family hydrolase [Mesorhizobium sp. M0136]|uniref:CocE/NonD family hydrolase n=1 Tax=Mesorhizobium sp. M0136 TaxID=2956890 RepID=UPI0033384C04